MMRKEVTPDAIQLYVMFVQENALCMPARDKPAPTRRKDETAAAWLGVSLDCNTPCVERSTYRMP